MLYKLKMSNKTIHSFLLFILALFFGCTVNESDIIDRSGNYSGKMYVHTDTVYMDLNNDSHYDFWDDTLITTITVKYIGNDAISFSNELNAIFQIVQEEEYSTSSGVIAPVSKSTWRFSNDTLIYVHSYNSVSGAVSKSFAGLR